MLHALDTSHVIECIVVVVVVFGHLKAIFSEFVCQVFKTYLGLC